MSSVSWTLITHLNVYKVLKVLWQSYTATDYQGDGVPCGITIIAFSLLNFFGVKEASYVLVVEAV